MPKKNQMNSIIEELWIIKDQIAKESNYDIKKISKQANLDGLKIANEIGMKISKRQPLKKHQKAAA